METLDASSFKQKIFDFDASQEFQFNGTRPAIIDFYADWCAPCQAMAPIIEEVAEEYASHVDVYKINTEVTPELAELFGVRGLPSIAFINSSEEPAISIGFMNKESFQKAISQLFGINL